MVIKAVGQEGRFDWLAPLGLAAKSGRFVVDPLTGATSHPKLFAGGDCAGEGGAEATVVAVVEAGKRAAFGIDARLGGPASRARGSSEARILGAPIPLRAASASPAYVQQGVHQS